MSVYSSPSAITPSTSRPSANISPPRQTMKIAKSAAGIATAIRAGRSELPARAGSRVAVGLRDAGRAWPATTPASEAALALGVLGE